MRPLFLMTVILMIMTTGCASPTYRQVFKEKPAGNFREFSTSSDLLFAAAAKVQCERNFIIEKEDRDKGFILGKRSFQRGRKTIILLMQSQIVSDAPDRSTLYVNALETTETYYIADHTRFFLFLVPLPGGGGKDVSTVKEAEKTITDKRFYKDFFEEIDKKVKDEQGHLARADQDAAIKAAVPQAEKNPSQPQTEKTPPQPQSETEPSAPQIGTPAVDSVVTNAAGS
jgi:hypothetical protein